MERKPLVLLVDDSQSLTEFCEFMLTHAGYRVATAANGKVGLALARNLRPGVILLDMMLPEIDGLTLIEHLRRDLGDEMPRIIAMSGFDVFEPHAHAPEIRAFLRKPIESDDLFAVLAAVEADLPIAPDVIDRQRRRAAAQRRAVRDARQKLLGSIDLDDKDLKERLRGVVEWCVDYFGVTAALVTIERSGRIRLEAAGGRDVAQLEGGELDGRLTFCAHVTKAGGPMLVVDATTNPALSAHPAVAMGYRFYAGAPLIAPGRIVLGTLCLLDHDPQVIHGEDITVLEALADGIARRIAALSSGQAESRGSFVAPGVFTAEILATVMRATLKRLVAEGGEVEFAVLDLGSSEQRSLRDCAQSVYAAAGHRRLLVAEHAAGLAIVAGPSRDDQARRQIEVAIDAIRNCGLPLRAAGVVTVRQTATPLEFGVLLSIAEECLVRSERSDASTERVVIPVGEWRASAPP